jgi:hypothetical protein
MPGRQIAKGRSMTSSRKFSGKCNKSLPDPFLTFSKIVSQIEKH